MIGVCRSRDDFSALKVIRYLKCKVYLHVGWANDSAVADGEKPNDSPST
jgi:hypothetical protein